MSSEAEGRIANMIVAGTLIIVATLGSLVVFVYSVVAIVGVYGWYPPFVAQQWFIYDELFAVFSFTGFLFGAVAVALVFSKRSFWEEIISGIACTLSGASVFVVSLIQPLALLWQGIAYYFLPLFMAPLIGTLLRYMNNRPKPNGHKH